MANWLKRLIGGNRGGKDDRGGEGDRDLPEIPWVAAADNPWGVPLLDVRPVTLGSMSMSQNPTMASNAVSFGTEDGTCFADAVPAVDRSVPAALAYPADPRLADGVLYRPDAMEDKWALFLHRGRVLFVRSWTRQVMAAADFELAGGTATLTRVRGAFSGDADEDPAFTLRVADFLVRALALGQPFPAPLPPDMADAPPAAAMWCMSVFGRAALCATPHPVAGGPPPPRPLRSDSLLHIALARGELAAARAQLDAGVPTDLLARDGLTALDWALAARDAATAAAALLLDRGSPVDVRSAEGATPLMTSVQAADAAGVDFLLARGADPDARDDRGFTALHRAAELGKPELVRRLLAAGATADVEAAGHTPLSLARGRGEAAVVALLGGGGGGG